MKLVLVLLMMICIQCACAGRPEVIGDDPNCWVFRQTGREIKGNNDKVLKNVASEDECAQACVDETVFACASTEFKLKNRKCFLSTATRASAGSRAFRLKKGVTYKERTVPCEAPWIPALIVYPGNGLSAFKLWAGPFSSNYILRAADVQLSVPTSLFLHYKSPLVESWDDLNITEVKVGLYVGGEEEVSLVFDGQGSDKMNWFSNEALKTSPWTDLKTGDPTYFSSEGIDDGNTIRRFYIHMQHLGCSNDFGWLDVFEQTNNPQGVNCPWEQAATVPQIYYSTASTRTQWQNDGNKGVAELMVVYFR